MTLARRTRVGLRMLLRRLVHLNATPKQVARGLAVGVFIGCTPLWGVQMILALLLATLLRANRIAAMAGTWISNVFTTVPLYGLALWLGSILFWAFGFRTRLSDSGTIVARIKVFVAAPWREQLDKLLHMGGELLLGCIVLGALLAVVAYFVTYWLVEARQRFLAERRAKMSADDQTRSN